MIMLTVLMPISRIDDHLSAAIESVKAQTFREFVCHILCSDLSDTEFQDLERFVDNDSRFVIHKLHLNGIAFALNFGLNLVTSKYTARMDGDDLCHPKRFAKQIDFLENNPNYCIVGCRVKLIDHNGSAVAQEFKYYQNNSEIRSALRYRMPLCHPALIFRSRILFDNKGYLYGNTAEDHELYLRVARDPECLFKNLPDHLFSYRRHEGQLTNISHAHTAFYNISGFLFTEFLRTWDVVFLLGIIANSPYMRRLRQIVRSFRS